MRVEISPSYEDAISLPMEGRNLVPVDAPLPPAPNGDVEPDPAVENAHSDTPLGQITRGVDVRAISPKQMSELGLDLYVGGMVSFEDYSALAFQPELHPDFDRTIGALTGESAHPDQPRDFVNVWEERLNFERRYNPQNSTRVSQTERIVNLLSQISNPTDVSV